MQEKINNCKYFEISKKNNKVNFSLKSSNIFFKLKKKDVLVKILYSSINYRDFLASQGNIAVARRFPYVPGVDLVGTIIKSSKKNFVKGDRVAAFAVPNESISPGAWSSYCLINEKNLFKVPKKWNSQDIISIGTAGLAALSGIDSILKNSGFSSKKNFSLLVTGASGGVGSIACLLGKILGWNIIAVTRNIKKKKKYLKSLGVQKIIESRKFLSVSQMNLLPQEYNAVVDCLGGRYLSTSIKKLKNNGVCAISGLIAGQELSGMSVLPFLMRGIFLSGSGAEVINQETKRRIFKLIEKLIKSKKLKKIRKNISLNKVSIYLKNWPKDKTKGRLIIKIS